MNMRSANNPFGGTSLLVDRLIGNEYATVKSVARNLDAIKYVVFNMESIVAVAEQLQRVGNIQGNLSDSSNITVVQLPEGITAAHIESCSLVIRPSAGVLITPESGLVTHLIEGNQVKITYSIGSGISFANGHYTWTYVLRG